MALGSPKNAAETILSERGIKASAGKILAKAFAFAAITAVSMYFLWNYVYAGMFIMPFFPLGLLLFAENGKLTGLAKKRVSVSGIVSCIAPMINIFLFARLTDSLLMTEMSALFPLSAAITAVTAASLTFAVLSVKSNPYGIIILALGIAASLCIAALQVYAAFHINDGHLGGSITEQTALRARYINIFITTLYIAEIIIFLLSAFRRDKSSFPCMYTALGTLMLISGERNILTRFDISAKNESILRFVPDSLFAEAFGIIILSVIITVFCASRKAKSNG